MSATKNNSNAQGISRKLRSNPNPPELNDTECKRIIDESLKKKPAAKQHSGSKPPKVNISINKGSANSDKHGSLKNKPSDPNISVLKKVLPSSIQPKFLPVKPANRPKDTLPPVVTSSPPANNVANEINSGTAELSFTEVTLEQHLTPSSSMIVVSADTIETSVNNSNTNHTGTSFTETTAQYTTSNPVESSVNQEQIESKTTTSSANLDSSNSVRDETPRSDPTANNGEHGPSTLQLGISDIESVSTVLSKVARRSHNPGTADKLYSLDFNRNKEMARPSGDIDFYGIANSLDEYCRNKEVSNWNDLKMASDAIRKMMQAMANLICQTSPAPPIQVATPTAPVSLPNTSASQTFAKTVALSSRQPERPIARPGPSILPQIVVRNEPKPKKRNKKNAYVVKITASNDPKTSITELEKLSDRVVETEPFTTVVTERGTVLINTKTAEDAKKLKDSLADTTLSVAIEGKSMPRARILRVPAHITEESVTTALGPGGIVLTAIGARDAFARDIIVAIPGNRYQEVIEVGSIRLSRFVACEVKAHKEIQQCRICLQLGHGPNSCPDELKSKGQRCAHCAEFGHITKECPSKLEGEIPVCANCKDNKVENDSHSAFSNRCPIKLRYTNRRNRNTDWGDGDSN